jgi:putative ABC transport system substrate-binding protein
MKRREFITLAVGAAAAWPLAARAQQAAMPVIGYLGSTTAEGYAQETEAIRQGFREGGFVEGKNLTIEYRWANGQYDQLPALASDLVRRGVAAIVTTGGGAPALASKAATTSIPIIFATGGDPVQTGLVPSLSRPGGNITGVSYYANALAPKRLEIIHEVLPRANQIAMLMNPNSPSFASDKQDMQAAAQSIGVRFLAVLAAGAPDLEAAFATVIEQRVDALLVNNDAALVSENARIAALAARYSVPAIYSSRRGVEAGGLMSYGTNSDEMLHQAGIYVTRILKGEKPADLPVILPTRFELVINLKIARTLGITVPADLLSLADEVIE